MDPHACERGDLGAHLDVAGLAGTAHDHVAHLQQFPTHLLEDHSLLGESPVDRRQDPDVHRALTEQADRKSTRLNSSHVKISYAVFCLKKKKRKKNTQITNIYDIQ